METNDKELTDEKPPEYVATSSPPSRAKSMPIGGALGVFSLLGDLSHAKQENFVCIDLDVRHRVIERRLVHLGTLTDVNVHPREIFRGAILNAAAAVIVAHNHPSGDPTPSRADIEMTRKIRESGDLLGIPVLDHVVIGADGYVSFASRGWCP